MLFSIDAEKACNTIWHPFVLTIVCKLGLERNFLKITQSTYQKPTANITFNNERPNTHTKIQNKVRLSGLVSSAQHHTRSPSRCCDTRDRNKSIQTGKEEENVFVYRQKARIWYDSLKKIIKFYIQVPKTINILEKLICNLETAKISELWHKITNTKGDVDKLNFTKFKTSTLQKHHRENEKASHRLQDICSLLP